VIVGIFFMFACSLLFTVYQMIHSFGKLASTK
jgi:hypothetical protein